ncbi:MAG: glucosyl-3-phosphoglycerate synthase, partial [Dehalococcoidia bacterium]|nr:glucosyl-3-phosphoglycerate synthase [Dehalococcoidia bacterium]
MVKPDPVGEKVYKVLVPIADPVNARDLMRIAAGVSDKKRVRAIVLGVVEVPEDQSFVGATGLARRQRRLLQQVASLAEAENIEIRMMVRLSRQAWQGIQEVVLEEGVDLVILGWRGETRSDDKIFGTTIDEIVKNPPCDIALVKQKDLTHCKRILLPVRGGPHAELALRLVVSLAENLEATATVLHVELTGASQRRLASDRRSFAEFASLISGSPRVRSLRVTAASVEEAILASLADHQLLVMGAAAFPADSQPYLFGAVAEAVVSKAPATAMVVKSRNPVDPAIFEDRPEPLPALVDKWFGENTFHNREFSRLDDLIALKKQQNLTVGLLLPTLNEEDTIGAIIRNLKSELVESKPFLDEIVVIDGGSTDRTCEIARELQVPVYRQEEILPELGGVMGKGEALWKSLYVMNSDIIVWLDGDIRNIHPKFVYGLVGPLLREQRIQFVKGFCHSPVPHEGFSYDTAREQVTELTIRPLLNLFFPELSGIIQPLGGENAVRRGVLESVPIHTGYGMEMALLIDVFERFGLSAIAQADLEEKVDRVRELMAMSKVSFAIIQVVIKELEERSKVRLLEDVNKSMKVINYADTGTFSLEEVEIDDIRRPPMITSPSYVAKRSQSKKTVSPL